MDKLLKEVFPTLKLNNDLNSITDDVFVTRIVSSKRRDSFNVHISSNHLIERRRIKELAKQIKKQVFNASPVDVNFIEKFNLSTQYNLSSLWKIYSESILEEFKDRDQILYSLLKKADVIVDDENTLLVTIEDTSIAHAEEENLARILDKIICERCV